MVYDNNSAPVFFQGLLRKKYLHIQGIVIVSSMNSYLVQLPLNCDFIEIPYKFHCKKLPGKII